jgi:hypothetical protein
MHELLMHQILVQDQTNQVLRSIGTASFYKIEEQALRYSVRFNNLIKGS